jgi:hypothetical protein
MDYLRRTAGSGGRLSCAPDWKEGSSEVPGLERINFRELFGSRMRALLAVVFALVIPCVAYAILFAAYAILFAAVHRPWENKATGAAVRRPTNPRLLLRYVIASIAAPKQPETYRATRLRT